MSQIRLLGIESEHWQIGILPDTGASVAFGKIKYGDQWRDFLRPTVEADYTKVSHCSSFVLVPYSNRIRDRRFSFRGQHYELRPSKPDGTVMHGVGRDLPWHIESADSSHVATSFHSMDYADINFPWRFSAKVEYRVQSSQFSITLSLKNEDNSTMPGGFGNHPYFQRAFAGERDMASVQIPCDEYFPLEDSLPTGAPQPIPPRLDFRQLRPVTDDSINDCLTGRQPDKPVRIVYAESGQQVTLSADPIFECLIFFTPPGKPFFAIEPVTNANDGFNLYAQGVPHSGVFELEPGQEKSGSVHFTL